MTKQITNQTKKLERGEMDLCIQKFLEYLKQQGFSNSILQRYESYLIKFKNFCIFNNFLEFLSEKKILQYLQSLVGKHHYTIQFSRNRCRRRRTAGRCRGGSRRWPGRPGHRPGGRRPCRGACLTGGRPR